MTSPVWDPELYERHSAHRNRPSQDLLARVPSLPDDETPHIADLGCGPGGPSLLLAERWPRARITGYDNSPAMLREARAYAGKTPAGGSLEFVDADLSTWRPGPGDHFDLLFSNAALHWVAPAEGDGEARSAGGDSGTPGHAALFPSWLSALPPGGVFCFQVPGNFDAPSHALLLELRNSPRWRGRLGTASRSGSVLDPPGYLDVLDAMGCDVDAWETTYAHVLHGEDAVLDWVKGTGLRPVLTRLADDPAARAEFLDEYGKLLREAYPPLGGDPSRGTVFPFRRVFVVAVKR
jgi:trans-aconitate 2-methyltransferase